MLSVRTIASGRPSSNGMTSAVSVLPQPGGPHSSTPIAGPQAVCVQDLLPVVLAKKLLDERAVS